MIKRLDTFELHCEHCRKVSRPFVFACTLVVKEPSAEDYPFGWGSWRTGGWGKTNFEKSQDLCPECLAKAKVENYGTIRESRRTVLDGLAEIE